MADGKSIIIFTPSFRQSCKDNLGWSEEEIRQFELDTIKRQAKLREGIKEKMMSEELTESNAIFSQDRRYRFALWRFWDERPKVMFICLNPSTADEVKNDPTVSRCINFAYQWDYGGLYVCNIFGLRSTNPKELYSEYDPVGRGNDLVMLQIKGRVEKCIAAWGNHGVLKDRWKRVVGMLAPLYCFGLTKLGQPKHPLYLPQDSEIIFWK